MRVQAYRTVDVLVETRREHYPREPLLVQQIDVNLRTLRGLQRV